MASPTQRSLKHLREQGWTACVVEKWIPQIKRRKDVFGFGDLLAIRVWDMTLNGEHTDLTVKREIALVQTTSLNNMAARRDKIMAIPEAAYWKRSGGMILLHGWAKRGPRGQRKTWQVKEEIL